MTIIIIINGYNGKGVVEAKQGYLIIILFVPCT